METKAFDYKKFNEFRKTPTYWGRFDAANSQHKYILSLLRQMGWDRLNTKTGRAYADMDRFGRWLQSSKAPVRKPLMKMDVPECKNRSEVSITISALESMVQKKYQ